MNPKAEKVELSLETRGSPAGTRATICLSAAQSLHRSFSTLTPQERLLLGHWLQLSDPHNECKRKFDRPRIAAICRYVIMKDA